ncbi:hypothetical protein IEQ34_004853 [Dendrobium chrysotoxum]|uniref:Uncharacterized protein n=1 Tax=Dendrobium chrysotoxum TaxID=161865 RepID=A0AAV7HB90_DENCH|nr:hypothetical protein IEQ34_004853 [Dendrobium chrysotoxum]
MRERRKAKLTTRASSVPQSNAARSSSVVLRFTVLNRSPIPKPSASFASRSPTRFRLPARELKGRVGSQKAVILTEIWRWRSAREWRREANCKPWPTSKSMMWILGWSFVASIMARFAVMSASLKQGAAS